MTFGIKGPPNSPPIDFVRLTSNTRITRQASVQNRVTEKAKLRHKRRHLLCNCGRQRGSDAFAFVTLACRPLFCNFQRQRNRRCVHRCATLLPYITSAQRQRNANDTVVKNSRTDPLINTSNRIAGITVFSYGIRVELHVSRGCINLTRRYPMPVHSEIRIQRRSVKICKGG